MNARYAQLAARVAAALHKARPRAARHIRLVANTPTEAATFAAAVHEGVLPPAVIRTIVQPEPQSPAPQSLAAPDPEPEPPPAPAVVQAVARPKPIGPVAYCANCGGEMPDTDARPHLHEDCRRFWQLATQWRDQPPRFPRQFPRRK